MGCVCVGGVLAGWQPAGGGGAWGWTGGGGGGDSWPIRAQYVCMEEVRRVTRWRDGRLKIKHATILALSPHDAHFRRGGGGGGG